MERVIYPPPPPPRYIDYQVTELLSMVFMYTTYIVHVMHDFNLCNYICIKHNTASDVHVHVCGHVHLIQVLFQKTGLQHFWFFDGMFFKQPTWFGL